MTPLIALMAIAEPNLTDLRQRGFETLESIRRELYIPERKLYAESVKTGERPTQPAFNWPAGVQLSALNAAARLDPKFKPWAAEYGDAMRVYWRPADQAPEVAGRRVGGFDVLPLPKDPDRYYDDNAWFVMGYAETFELTGEPRFLTCAKEAYEYAMSGWDEKLGGGIYWRESDRASKNTCSNAPVAAGALELYRLTQEKRYLDEALSILSWTRQHLQDPKDGLMWDAIGLDGKIGKMKWTYNTALMVRSYAMLASLSSGSARERHLAEASRMIEAAIKHWGREDGGIACDASFAHLLTEAILMTNRLERHPEWEQFVVRSLDRLHAKGRDAAGHYAKRWDESLASPRGEAWLMHQASAARAFAYAALALGKSRAD